MIFLSFLFLSKHEVILNSFLYIKFFGVGSYLFISLERRLLDSINPYEAHLMLSYDLRPQSLLGHRPLTTVFQSSVLGFLDPCNKDPSSSTVLHKFVVSVSGAPPCSSGIVLDHRSHYHPFLNLGVGISEGYFRCSTLLLSHLGFGPAKAEFMLTYSYIIESSNLKLPLNSQW